MRAAGIRIGLVVLLAGLFLAVGLGAWWWWTPAASTGPEQVARVRPVARPAWARGPRSFRGVTLPPVSDPTPPPAPVERDSDEAEDDGFATVSGWIVNDQGTNVAGGFATIRCTGPDGDFGFREEGDEQGFFERQVPAPASCTVVGERRDGLLRARSSPLTLEIEESGDFLEIDLVVPSRRTGGIGVTIAEHDLGIEAVLVHEGTPAWEAGLRSGDIVTKVVGVDAVDLSPDDFVSRMTGPEGTDVAFQALVRGEDGEWVERDFVLQRRYLSEGLFR